MATKNAILIALSQSDKTQFGRQDFESQTTAQKIFSAIWSLESEVNNGGFSQYFLNESCETAAFVPEALEAIGRHELQIYANGPYQRRFQRVCPRPRKRSLLRLPNFPTKF